MKQRKFLTFTLLLMIILFLQPDVYGADPGCDAKIKLRDYEPNIVGIRKDSNDDQNLDFVVSQMFPIFHNGCKGSRVGKDWIAYPYFAFTGEFGFYAFGGRDSRPVIGKRFNPKFFFRRWLGEEGDYLDIGYAHESNGQSINTESTYLQKRAEIVGRDERADFANDYLSRGWDYIDLVYKKEWEQTNLFFIDNSIYIKLKYFLENSPLQGRPEEYYPWETSEGKLRKEVDGITIMLKASNISEQIKKGMKAAVTYTTGYNDTFDNNTVKLELTYKIEEWPLIIIWGANGYNSDLSDYYKNVTSFGIGLELRNFLEDY